MSKYYTKEGEKKWQIDSSSNQPSDLTTCASEAFRNYPHQLFADGKDALPTSAGNPELSMIFQTTSMSVMLEKCGGYFGLLSNAVE